MCNVSVKVFIFMYKYSILIEVNVTVRAFQIFLKVKPLQMLTLNFKLLFFCSCSINSVKTHLFALCFPLLPRLKHAKASIIQNIWEQQTSLNIKWTVVFLTTSSCRVTSCLK